MLGQYLRDLRRQAGLTVKLAARLLEWSEPKLWRIETGQNAMRALDVQAMCATYGAPPGLTEALAGLAGQNRSHGWWRAHDDTIPDGLGIYTALEDAASRLTSYAPFQVPGLLRTESYARAVTASTSHSSAETDRLVHDCLARQVLLTRQASTPPQMSLALDEALLHHPVGGLTVMACQLRFLADLAALPNLSLRVVPNSAGHHPGLAAGAFTLLDFPLATHAGDTNTAIVYTTGLTGELYLDNPHDVDCYRAAHAAILGCALDETATQDMLLAAAKNLEL